MQLPLANKEPYNPSQAKRSICLLVTFAISAIANPVAAHEPGIRFEALENDLTGLDYARAPSTRLTQLEAIQDGSLTAPLAPTDLPIFPGRVFGIAGVAVLDHDGDGDLDIFVTNGPGAANSLFVNQLVPTGHLRFVDRAAASGVDSPAMEASGTCFGDLDNDGDPELLVLGLNEPNRLYENRGGGHFVEVNASGLEGGNSASTSCTMGDIDGDGRLDVFIGSSWDQSSLVAIFIEPFAFNQPNELFHNEGGLSFADVSATSGIRAFATLPPGTSSLTWSASMVDVDLDGDVDLVHADDQGAFPIVRDGGIDRGLLQVFLNDGTGHFVNAPIALDEQAAGSWMGVGFGDLNCDGAIDVLGSNFGDYGIPIFGAPYTLGDQRTRWFYGNGDGTFTQPDAGELASSPFAWGNTIADFDLDGDQDMAYYGGLLIGTVVLADNPGTVLENIDCGARFALVEEAHDTDFRRRPVSGVALGDLDRDQRPDVVVVSMFEAPEPLPLLPPPVTYGTPFDALAAFAPMFTPTPSGFVWSGVDLRSGGLSVDRNLSTGHHGITVETLGTFDLVDGASTNRDGIGAVVSFTPRRSETTMVPMQGGSSHASQHAMEAYFGLGDERFGTVEVLWPGGVRNRLYRVRRGEHVSMPEIPCSFDDATFSLSGYLGCVLPALGRLRTLDQISRRDAFRLLASGIRAFLLER